MFSLFGLNKLIRSTREHSQNRAIEYLPLFFDHYWRIRCVRVTIEQGRLRDQLRVSEPSSFLSRIKFVRGKERLPLLTDLFVERIAIEIEICFLRRRMYIRMRDVSFLSSSFSLTSSFSLAYLHVLLSRLQEYTNGNFVGTQFVKIQSKMGG